MNPTIETQLRAAKRMLSETSGPNKPPQKASSVARRLLREGIDVVLAADDDQWLEMIWNYTAASNPGITRLTVDVLIQRLLSEDQTIVARVTTWLAILGTPAVAALNVKLLKSRSRKLGLAAAEALGHISGTLSDHERQMLWLKLDTAALRTRHPEVRNACVEAMIKIRNFKTSPPDGNLDTLSCAFVQNGRPRPS